MPANLACELQLNFLGKGGKRDFYEDFEKPVRLSIPLATGENLVEVHFDWDHVPNVLTVTNHTTADSIRVLAKDARGEGWTPGLGQGFYKSEEFSPERGMAIFEGGLGLKATHLVVQMVESKKP